MTWIIHSKPSISVRLISEGTDIYEHILLLDIVIVDCFVFALLLLTCYRGMWERNGHYNGISHPWFSQWI